MLLFKRIRIALKTIQQLGIKQVAFLGLYRLGIKTGYFRLRTPVKKQFNLTQIPPSDMEKIVLNKQQAWNIPPRKILLDQFGNNKAALLTEADEIVNGQIRLFGNNPVPLQMAPGGALNHWSSISDEGKNGEDIKFIWEPARFCWTFSLGRAYAFSGDEKYPEAFWRYVEKFFESNPVNLGPNWVSAQEVAIRILAFTFALQVFQFSSHTTKNRQATLLKAIEDHADRIPPTLIYARAQNNNHLLVEAAGLYTAGIMLSHIPRSNKWRQAGWYWFNKALMSQIEENGVYIQQSMNYHRLMLQVALWMKTIGEKHGDYFPDNIAARLISATTWLLTQIDPSSGKSPNLGHNDGAYIFPFPMAEFYDYRPVGQAASIAFLGKFGFPHGPWDELSYWLGLECDQPAPETATVHNNSSVLRLGTPACWGTIRAAQFKQRPAHADQLHVDLWWHGQNIARDAGTFRYTAPVPWNNALAHTCVHNTLTIEETDQMEKAGRFLWLDWAKSSIHTDPENENTITAEHDGYRLLGYIHRRSLTYIAPCQWEIIDHILPTSKTDKSCKVSLHWLLPDSTWVIKGTQITLQLPYGTIKLHLVCNDPQGKFITDSDKKNPLSPKISIRLIRAGVTLLGRPKAHDEIMGWYSETYGKKVPAISFAVDVMGKLPLTITSQWGLSNP